MICFDSLSSFCSVFFRRLKCFQSPPSSITAGCTQSWQVQKMESGEAKSVAVGKMEVHNEVVFPKLLTR